MPPVGGDEECEGRVLDYIIRSASAVEAQWVIEKSCFALTARRFLPEEQQKGPKKCP